jgi:hypothetical protein
MVASADCLARSSAEVIPQEMKKTAVAINACRIGFSC